MKPGELLRFTVQGFTVQRLEKHEDRALSLPTLPRYEFGGGAVADMGHHSLWSVFQEFDLDAPYAVESTPSHVCAVTDQVCAKIRNDYAFREFRPGWELKA